MTVAMRKSKKRHLWVAAAAAGVVAYVTGYPLIFWLEGRGIIGVYDAIGIEGTAYWPIQQYRLSQLPGGQGVQSLRAWCFSAGQESIRK
jgi:hypothetical protein